MARGIGEKQGAHLRGNREHVSIALRTFTHSARYIGRGNAKTHQSHRKADMQWWRVMYNVRKCRRSRPIQA